MFELKLTCDKCGKNEIRESVDFLGWLRDGGNKIYCSQKCREEGEEPKVSKAAKDFAHSFYNSINERLSTGSIEYLAKGADALLLKQRQACLNVFYTIPIKEWMANSETEKIENAILSAQIEE